VWAMEIQYWFPIQKVIYSGYRFSMWIYWRVFFYSLCIFGVPAVKDAVWDLLIFILVWGWNTYLFRLDRSRWAPLETVVLSVSACGCDVYFWCLVGLRPIEEIQLPSLY
jgi:hypothetical protein